MYFSEIIAVKSGVIQGSVLGPLLFLLCAWDLDPVVQNSMILKYADDMKLFAAFPRDVASQQLIGDNLEDDLNGNQESSLKSLLNVTECKSTHLNHSNINKWFLPGCIHNDCIEQVLNIKI